MHPRFLGTDPRGDWSGLAFFKVSACGAGYAHMLSHIPRTGSIAERVNGLGLFVHELCCIRVVEAVLVCEDGVAELLQCHFVDGVEDGEFAEAAGEVVGQAGGEEGTLFRK